jgi:catechol 2,3-dioxygenase-like lactoylglutathione lyase family enzyme
MREQDIAIPQLPSRSIEKTMAFYSRLGLKGVVVGPANDYAILDRGSLELHFFLHEAQVPAESAFSGYLRVQDVETVFREFSAANLPSHGIPRVEKLENKPWGMREFAVVDEDGTLIRIGQVL